MEERENRKGPGVFYAVIGVATLVVAIIGATFAYFSVTTQSAANAVTGETGEGAKDNFSLTVDRVSTDANGKLIPLAQNLMPNALTASQQCVDSNGNTVCQVYKITVTNSGDNALRVAGKLVLTSDAVSMKWEKLASQTAQEATPVVRNVTEDTAGSLEANRLLTAKGGTYDYYVIVWLDETNQPQDATAEEAAAENATVTAEAKKAFNGQVTFSALNANGQPTTGLTATFSSGA